MLQWFVNSSPIARASYIFIVAFMPFSFSCNKSTKDEEPSHMKAGVGGTRSADILSGTGGIDDSTAKMDANTESPKNGSDTVEDAESADRIGGFLIRLVDPVPETSTPGSTSVTGAVSDAPLPKSIIWEVTAQENGCALLEPRNPFCDPPCQEGICEQDGVCTPNPSPINLGSVHLKGLQTAQGSTEVSMVQVAGKYQVAETLPYPAFVEGEEIRLEAEGGDVEPFAILSHGISRLEILNQGPVMAEPGQPMRIEWTIPTQPELARIDIEVDISHHGGTKGKIECQVEDTGFLEIPATLVSQLLALGYAGFPSVIVARKAVGTTEISFGLIELIVQSGDEHSIEIPGLISCNTSADTCPNGQTCQQDLTCH